MVISLCALLGRFHPPDSFAKPPPRFSVCESALANRFGPFVFKCSLCWPHGPFSISCSCAVPGRFHPPDSFAKPPPRFSVCDSGTPIAPDRLFLNVRSVDSMTRPPYRAPVPSLAGFILLILLQSPLLDFPCATPAKPIAQDHLFLNVRYAICSWLKNR